MLTNILVSHASLLLNCLSVDESLKLIVPDDEDDNLGNVAFRTEQMIHIDRNHHSPLSNSPHSKQNLILPNQHSLQISSTWSDLPQRPPNSQSDGSKLPQDQKRDPATPSEGDPVVSRPSGPESPASPADGNSTSPTAEERSSSLSPVPETTAQTEQNADTTDTKPSEDRIPSRVSTPLSELSPPPDDMDTPAADTLEPPEKKESGENRVDDENVVKSQAEVNGVNSPKPAISSSQQLSSFTTSGSGADGGSEAHLHHPPSMNHSPMLDGITSAPAHSSEQKVAMMLELNSELLKVSMEFQTRGIQLSDSRFQQYASRIKSNLDYMARWADNTINPAALPTLPIVDAPPPVEFTSTERIQQLYSELSALFAKALSQRNQPSSATPQPMTPTPTLKRERSEDVPLDMMNKRRDTGESKVLNSPSMMPPPSLPQSQQQENQYPSASSTPMPNGMMSGSAQSQSAQISEQIGAGGVTNQPAMMNANEAQMVAQRQAAMRLQQQRQNSQQGMGTRQMSPPSSGAGNMNQQVPSGGGMQNQMNGVGASHPQMTGGGVGLTAQQAYAILNTPNHPLLALLMKQLPGFATLPVPEQLRKISQFATIKMHEQQHQQQQNAINMGRSVGSMPNMSSPMNNMGMGVNASAGGLSTGMGMTGNQFSNSQPGQVSPVAHQAQMAQDPMMMGQGGSGSPSGIDPQRSMAGTPQLGGVPNSPMNMNQMTQRQLMLMQQQQQNRGGGNMGGGGMNPANMMMNPQQQMAFMQQQQERMRQQQQMQAPAGSPTHSHGGVGSPMLTGSAGGDNNSFPPVLRSNSAIPGIARSARSPPDGGVQSPMTPRMPNRGSMGQDDFARMLMQQQQGGQQRGMQPQSGFNPQQQMQASSNWQQQQQMGLGPNSPYGMNNRPDSAAGFAGGGSYGGGVGGGGQGSNSVVGGGSPPGLSQTWGTPNNNPNASYPFATSSPGHQSDLAPTRHMSATPAPGQQPMQAQNMISPTSADPFLFANDFPFPNWTQ
ncbi:hypothetical protein L218DRAFT_1073660 [Marasmius fiardii PR-910]|nr:hypothetical protein L218DRAFT_1073660 [Marasmius fiardii PR-910]